MEYRPTRTVICGLNRPLWGDQSSQLAHNFIDYGIGSLPEELLGHLEGLHKVIYITRKLRPAFSK